jgi:chorismate mutase
VARVPLDTSTDPAEVRKLTLDWYPTFLPTTAARDPTLELAAVEDFVALELRRLRDSIDNMDAALVHLLAERFKITQQVGQLKAEHGLPPADPAREAEQIGRLRALASEAKLDPEFAEKFLNFVVAEVVRHHEAAIGVLPAGGAR